MLCLAPPGRDVAVVVMRRGMRCEAGLLDTSHAFGLAGSSHRRLVSEAEDEDFLEEKASCPLEPAI